MKKSIIAKSILAAGILPLLAGCVVEGPPPRRVVVVQPAPPPPVVVAQPAQPPPEVVVQPAQPPPPKVELMAPSPGVAYVWVPGGWEWRGRWVWARGFWGLPPRHGAVWVGGGWVYRGHGYVWVRGHWR